MKPFSLEWWLDMHRTTYSVFSWYLRNEGYNKSAKRFRNLHRWIEQRIIKKFDQKPE